MYTLSGFYIYPSHTSIPLKQFLKLIPLQLHFPNLNPIFFLVYFHESSHSVPSIPIVFQPSSIILHYKIPVFSWLFLRFLFSFFNFITDACVIFFNFRPAFFSASRNFYCFIPVFQSLLFPYPFHLSSSFFLFPGFLFPCGGFDFFPLPSPFAWGAIFEMGLGTSSSCSSRLPPISSTANRASLSTELYILHIILDYQVEIIHNKFKSFLSAMFAITLYAISGIEKLIFEIKWTI